MGWLDIKIIGFYVFINDIKLFVRLIIEDKKMSDKFYECYGFTETRNRYEKTTEAQEGRSFEELRAMETIRKIERLVEKQFGKKIALDEERPWPGAFSLVEERIVWLWIKMLDSNGLGRFSDKINIDWFTKAESLQSGKIGVKKTPIGSEPFFRFPRCDKDLGSLVFRIVVIDPQFLDPDSKKPLYKEIPQEYIEAVLNTFNPNVLFQLFGKDLPDMLQRAGTLAQPFEQLMKVVANKWKGKTIPTDYKTLQDYLHMGLIHEMVHALALHVPDEIPNDVQAEDQERQREIGCNSYLEIINKDQNIQTSVVFFKNLLKALQKTAQEKPSDETQSNIINILALEMMCDRFSMYLYENFLKLNIYNNHLEERLGYPINIDMLIALDKARKAEKLAGRQEMNNLDEAGRQKLEKELNEAERDHVYIRKFGDPVISAEEWSYYTGLLEWLKQLDRENKIMKFDMRHANSSRYIRISVSGLTD